METGKRGEGEKGLVEGGKRGEPLHGHPRVRFALP